MSRRTGRRLSTLAIAAPKAERANKYFDVSGKVIQIDQNDRTFLVTEARSNKLYLIQVKGSFKITFGRYMQLTQPEFGDVWTGERISIRCKHNDKERLARLEDGRTVTVLTSAP